MIDRYPEATRTKRMFRANREAALRNKIAHLRAAKWNTQADSLQAELVEWREALATDPEPEQTVTTRIEAEAEAASVEMPDEDEF